jgi:transcriptional regulator with XRE-family HTH domain
MGGPGSGRKQPERRRQAEELCVRGLTLTEIARALGVSRQAVHHLLGYGRPGPQPRKAVLCTACRSELGPAPSTRDYAPSLCLPCLARQPRATFGQRLRAHRLALGLRREALAERAGVIPQTICNLERGAHAPQPGTLLKLARALGITPRQLQPSG